MRTPSFYRHAESVTDTSCQLHRWRARATNELVGVGFADADPLKISCLDGDSRGDHGSRCMHSAYFTARALVCGARDDGRVGGMQNERMSDRNNLKAWRKFRHLTQEELAEKAGTTKAVVSNLETGVRPLSAKWLERFAPILHTTAGYILDHDPNDLPTAVLDVWADIPEESRAQALRVLESFKRTGTTG